MAKYIAQESAVKLAEKYGLANGSVLGRHTGLADCIASEIASLPAADVAPVVHGKWDDSGRYTFPGGGTAVRCTNCGGKARLIVGDGVSVICFKCYASTMTLTDNMKYESNAVETVVEVWNRRADNGNG